MNRIDPEEFVTIMKPELERVAHLAIRKRRGAMPIAKNGSDDESIEHEAESESRIGILSAVDLEIQEALLKFAHQRWPFISVLAEEETETRGRFEAGSTYCLLVDPIDGTRPYLAGASEFCHTISLMKGSSMLVSMIYSHAKEKMYAAIERRGAYVLPRDAAPERVELEPAEGNTFLCHVSRVSPELMTDLRTAGYDVKQSSQNATDILSMLDGGIAGFISRSPIVYDTWSPAAIVQEAGGWLSDWLGDPLRFDQRARIPHILVSGSERMAKPALSVLARHLSA